MELMMAAADAIFFISAFKAGVDKFFHGCGSYAYGRIGSTVINFYAVVVFHDSATGEADVSDIADSFVVCSR